LSNEKKRFPPENRGLFFAHMDNSMCYNVHRVVDELRRLKILKAPHPPYSSDISPCEVWMFRDFKGNLKDRHLQGPEEILRAFQEVRGNVTFEKLQMTFESWRDQLH
jgi:hypothetical protein